MVYTAVKLTADLTGPTVRIHATDVDGPHKDVFTTDIPSDAPFALFKVHRQMMSIAEDLGTTLDRSKMDLAGVRYTVPSDVE